MVDFKKVTYIATDHAIKQARKRSPFPITDPVDKFLVDIANKGSILFQINKIRFIRYKNFVLPCIRNGKSCYKIKTVLTWDMVYEVSNKGFQQRYNKHLTK